MKKGNTKSFSKLKYQDKKLITKSSANNIKNPNYKKYFPESSSNKKSQDYIKRKIKYNIFNQEKKQNQSNFSFAKDNENINKVHPKKEKRKSLQEKHLLLNINNVNTMSNNNIYHLNNTNNANTLTYKNNTNTNSQKELLTNQNISSKNSSNKNNFNIDERILLKIHKIKLKYEKKLKNDTLEIKSLTEKNDKLEELVVKLKETLDKANTMFPDFLEQIISTKSEKERESNRTFDIEYLKEENNKLQIENKKIKNEYNHKKEKLLKDFKYKEIKKDELYNSKLIDLNNQLNIKNSEIKNNLIEINEQKILVETIKSSNEKNEQLIKDMRKEIENLILENNDLKNNVKEIKDECNKKQKNNDKLNNNLQTLKNNYEIDIKNVKEKTNKELDIKIKENKKLNEIINDQEKVINELKEIIHKNNDKIMDFSQKNIELKEELNKANFFNKSKIEQINKELEELSKNYIKKVEAFTTLQKNNEELKSKIFNDINEIKQNLENKNIKQIQEEINQIREKINNLLVSENNKEIINELALKLSEINNTANKSQNLEESNIDKIYKEINIIKENIKLIESFKVKFEEKISNLINNSNTNYTTITKKRKEEESINTPIDIKIFTEENIMALEDKSNLNLSLDDRVVKKINFSENEKDQESNNINFNNIRKINNNLKNELQKKDNIILELQQEIKELKSNELNEDKNLVDDEEFNELVEENEELKKLNKELMQRLVEVTNTKDNNQNYNLININKKKKIIEEDKEMDILRKKLEELYRELNEYRSKNSELNNEIKNIKQKFNDF